MHIVLKKSKVSGDGYISVFDDNNNHLVCKEVDVESIDLFIKDNSGEHSSLCIQEATPEENDTEKYIVSERKYMNTEPVIETKSAG